MIMTTTFLGAIRLPSAASTCFPSPVTDRRYVLLARSYLYVTVFARYDTRIVPPTGRSASGASGANRQTGL